MRLISVVRVAVVAGLGVARSAGAGPFDGVYVAHPGVSVADYAACSAVDILIAADRVQYYDVLCDLSSPVQIRDMDALLFDGRCVLDGTAKQGRVLIRRMDSGDVALVAPFMDVRLAPCQVAG